MRRTLLLISLMTFLLTPLISFASTINVPSEQPTIQAGIDAASDGDTVLLADGTYTGCGNYNVDFKGKSMTVKSVSGPEHCIIDCQGNGRGFLVNNHETVTFEGLTIKNGDAGDGHEGGGIYANYSDIIVVDCVFNSNSASSGGAVSPYFSHSSFSNCTFTTNIASSRGGAVSPYYSSSFSNCSFTGNSANGDGGAVSTYASSSFSNCSFTGNSATDDGGAVSSDSESAITSFSNCTFTTNSASSRGGAVYCSSPPHSSSSFSNCIFTTNSASSGGAVHSASSFSNCSFTGNSSNGDGGAASSSISSSSFSKCSFTGNSANDSGGAVYSGSSFSNCSFNGNSANCGGAVSSSYSPISSNCTFTRNEATTQGGALWCNIPLASEDPIILKNCILWGNTAPEGPEIYEKQKPLVITYSDILGGHTGTGNIDTNPFFIHAKGGNLHLLYNSPCIDTGTADGAPANDLDGNPRPMLGGYDMGAYEVQAISDDLTIDAFITDPSTGGFPLAVNFTCIAYDNTYNITEYQWDFGDGNTETTSGGTDLHTYTNPGSFTATCTVVNDNSDQTTVSVAIEVTNDKPVAVAGPDQIVPGKAVDLDGSASNDPNGNIVSWTWTLEHLDNSSYDRTATGEMPTVANLEKGNYIVTLTVTDSYGSTGTDEMHLCVAGSSAIYTQTELDQAKQDSYDSGHTAGVAECPLRVDAEGNKFLDGPLIIENKGQLTIQ